MMLNCQHKWRRKPAIMKVGTVYNYKDSKLIPIYDPIYMRTKHASKFIKKYGSQND